MRDHAALSAELLPLAVELRLDRVCRSFETAWKAVGTGGPRPRIEECLADVEEADRGPLLRELLQVELHYRRGEYPSAEEYRQRFPGYAPLFESLFDQAPPSTVPDPPSQRAALRSSTPAGGSLPSIPGYDVLGVLGRGGMGVVYQARHRTLNRLVALKMILAGAHGGEQARTRFRTDAEALARLQHPNIVQIHEIGEHDGLPFLSLEFMAGGSLAQRLTGPPLPARQAAELVQTLAQAVHHAHQQDVIHRDLKPANVLLTGGPGTSLGESLPKITDFGLAKLLGHTGTVFGVTFSPDGRRLASAGLDETVKVWNTATGQEVLSLAGHPGAVASVAFSPDGQRLASASLDGTVKVWDAGPPD